ncbi:MAG TPA: sugar phosphate nucleotidyltransferase [Aquaticitalea sp.]|nr:sugar phosphate nucleotidyltransferase [Aquaticitalea sp.]
MNKPTLLILAGGLGSRYNGQKQVDSVSEENETLMEFALYDALKAGVGKFVFIINSMFPPDYMQHLKKILKQNNGEVHFIHQTLEKHIPDEFLHKLSGRAKPLGTGHAVYCAKDIIQEPFITMNADDFYGFGAFYSACELIKNHEITENSYGIAGFRLENTLSENGAVSRGICESKNGFLYKVEECTSIMKTGTSIRGLNEKHEPKELSGSSLVSMNLWVLHPSFFKLAKQDLKNFLDNNEDLSKVEFYLPSVIDRGIQSGQITVKLIPVSEKWFGLTYAEDKELVKKEIALRKEKGVYPEKLWN